MPGFNNDLVERNAYLQTRGVKAPGFTKTGTTIAGVIFKVCHAYTIQSIHDTGMQGSGRHMMESPSTNTQ